MIALDDGPRRQELSNEQLATIYEMRIETNTWDKRPRHTQRVMNHDYDYHMMIDIDLPEINWVGTPVSHNFTRVESLQSHYRVYNTIHSSSFKAYSIPLFGGQK